jgi:hypothetical protein
LLYIFTDVSSGIVAFVDIGFIDSEDNKQHDQFLLTPSDSGVGLRRRPFSSPQSSFRPLELPVSMANPGTQIVIPDKDAFFWIVDLDLFQGTWSIHKVDWPEFLLGAKPQKHTRSRDLMPKADFRLGVLVFNFFTWTYFMSFMPT